MLNKNKMFYMIFRIREFEILHSFGCTIVNKKTKSNTDIDVGSILNLLLDHSWIQNRSKIESETALEGLQIRIAT